MQKSTSELEFRLQRLTENEITEAMSPEKNRQVENITKIRFRKSANIFKDQSDKNEVLDVMSKPKKSSSQLYTRKFPCNLCGKILTEKQSLINHKMAVHENIKPHVCESCGKNFVRKSKLTEHYNAVHLKKRKYKCIPCNKEYSWPMSLKYHNDTVHNESIQTSAEQNQIESEIKGAIFYHMFLNLENEN